MSTMNEDLAFVASLAKKVQGDLHELQHIHVDFNDNMKLQIIVNEMKSLSYKVNQFNTHIVNKYKQDTPEPTQHETLPPLPASSEYLIRMRKFDEQNNTDHFTHDSEPTKE
jgi:hypothetical protein